MKLFDCSMRDGGYINNWFFSKEQARECYEAAMKCGIEYCEIGFRRTEHTNGPWFYTPENLINETFGNVYQEGCELALMAQMGTFTIEDFVPRQESLISMVRVLVAYHCRDKDDTKLDTELLRGTVEMCNKLIGLGYKVSINVGRIDKMSEEQIKQTCDIIRGTPIEYLYIADTYGNLGIYKMRALLKTIRECDPGVPLGFHAHDNLKNASVKSIDALYNGADIVDVTFGGFGRGSGNARTEFIIAHMENRDSRYKLLPALIYADKWVESYKTSGIPYLLSGINSMHVNYAIEIIEKHPELPIERVYEVLNKIVKNNQHNFYNSEVLTQTL